MARRVVITGGGTAGTLVANRLRRRHRPEDLHVTVVDVDDLHVYQPGLLLVPFGTTTIGDIVRPRGRQLLPGVDLVCSEVERLDLSEHRVELADGTDLPYDALVIASGATLLPGETEGLTGPGWMDRSFTFYTPDGAAALARALERFERGRLVVNVVDMPIKCPVAPLEFCFLADWWLRHRGRRSHVEIVYVTPLDGAFTKPVASQALAGLLEQKGIRLVTEFNTGEVDGAAGRLVSFDERVEPFDLAVVIPLHGGAPFVGRTPNLGDELGFVTVDEHTLQSRADPSVFAVGDAAAVPTSKAGSVAHFEGGVLVENVERFLDGRPLDASFDGHANCFVETGFGRAVLLDFNYETEPLPGHFPTVVGLPLLRESRFNHLAKLMFSWVYWHRLMPGRAIPGASSTMPERGKARAA